jgi:hypothetical protein
MIYVGMGKVYPCEACPFFRQDLFKCPILLGGMHAGVYHPGVPIGRTEEIGVFLIGINDEPP